MMGRLAQTLPTHWKRAPIGTLKAVWQACVRKRRFESLEAAEATSLEEKSRMFAYVCTWCKGWHLTSRRRVRR